MTEVEEKETLDILNQVRSMLSKAFEDESNCPPKSFSNPIATDYPIKSIKNQGEFKSHGWCEIETQGCWVRKLNVEKANKFFIRNLCVQLLSENGSILPREILLPTFLHELSHTGGFQLELVSISWFISHMTYYKFECRSHWWKIYFSKKILCKICSLLSECCYFNQ